MNAPSDRRADPGRRHYPCIAVVALVLARMAAGGGEPPSLGVGGATPAPAPDRPKSPRVVGDLGSAVQRALRFGYALARLRLQEAPRCSALFRDLGADGVSELERSNYRSGVAERCAHGVAALTAIGQPVVRLCPGFGGLEPRRAARTLIHEALHAAGLPERPAVRTAQSAEEINRMVEAGCGL